MRTPSQLLQRGRIGGLGVVLAIAAVAVLALVPWLLLALLVAVPGWPLLRRLRRESGAREGTA